MKTTHMRPVMDNARSGSSRDKIPGSQSMTLDPMSLHGHRPLNTNASAHVPSSRIRSRQGVYTGMALPWTHMKRSEQKGLAPRPRKREIPNSGKTKGRHCPVCNKWTLFVDMFDKGRMKCKTCNYMRVSLTEDFSKG